MTIHWCGTGLSSIPGLQHLLESGHDVVIWEKSVDTARHALGAQHGDPPDIRVYTPEAIGTALHKGDIIVSMLPSHMHMDLVQKAIDCTAHFVSSGYILPQMQALDETARYHGLCLVNEVGLDPGIDHIAAHHLVADYRASEGYHPENEISFISYCGGIPKYPNAFRYKFSWSPVGVLKALRAPSRSIRAFSELNVKHPWDAITSYIAPLPQAEEFEVYPNRDSIPYMADYQFEPSWRVKTFVRGTLRLKGWQDAWRPVFEVLEQLDGKENPETRLQELSQKLWADNTYENGEPDRVVMCVALKAERDGVVKYHKTYALDAWGDVRGSAMARLVSHSVALATEAILAREIPVGVSRAPHDPKLIKRWLETADRMAQFDAFINHLA